MQIGALAGMITSIGTFAACLLMPWIVTRLASRRKTAVFFFLGSFGSVISSYLIALQYFNSLALFFVMLPVLGFFTNECSACLRYGCPKCFRRCCVGPGLVSRLVWSLARTGRTRTGRFTRRGDRKLSAVDQPALFHLFGRTSFIALRQKPRPASCTLRLLLACGQN